MLLTPLSLTACFVAALLAACTDFRTRTIPNWLTLPLPSFAIAAHSVMFGFEGAALSAAGALMCFIPTYFLFVRGALGGGDVKLFLGLGALLGPREGLEVQLAAFVLISLYALWVTAWHGRLKTLLQMSYRATLHLILPSRFENPVQAEVERFELPMGFAILVSVSALCVRSVL